MGVFRHLTVFSGDQLEAIAYLLQYTDERGSFTDGDRDRDTIQQLRKEEKNTDEC